jgi:hypothetical protein
MQSSNEFIEILLSCRFSVMNKKKQQLMQRGMLVCSDGCFRCHINDFILFYYVHFSIVSS